MRAMALALGLFAWTAARADEPAPNDSGLVGFVRDADGRAPLAGAQLVFESAALPGPQDAVTDAAGAFEVRLLPAGSYTVTVCRAGFDDFSQSNVPLRAGKTLKVTITLQRSTSAAKAKCGAMASRQS